MGTHVHCSPAMSAYSALHLLRSYNHLLGPPGDAAHAYQHLLAPRVPDFSPHAADVSPGGGIPPFALPPAFMSPHGLLGGFPPYPPLLPLGPEPKTPPVLSRSMSSGASSPSKRPRGEKKPIPDEQKDEKYFERRKRNNQAAKKSRDARKIREDQIALRATMLEHENAILRTQVLTLREEAQSLRHLLLQRKADHAQQTPPSASDVIQRT